MLRIQIMRGDKTTATDASRKILAILKKEKISDISYGIIISIKQRKDSTIDVKIKEESGCLLLTITGKRYKQELRVYGIPDALVIKKMLEKSKHNIRIRI